MDCSILISTKNRAAALEKTLQAFRALRVPDGLRVEMIVVDNGSTDETPEVIARTILPSIELRGIREPLPGKCRALNSAIAQARGEALLFTDDDVVPAPNWLECMAKPLLEKRCDAVAGQILLAAELRRPWLTPLHARLLAETPAPAAKNPVLVGANMGIHKNVFDRIRGFDIDLGPGATGLGGEETLLWMQMVELGMSILPVTGTQMMHYPDASRLNHAGWVAAARLQGGTFAYIWHHWQHLHVTNTLISEYWTRLKLLLRVLLRRAHHPMAEGCPEWELSYRIRIETLSAYRKLAGQPRKYPSPAERNRFTANS